MRLCFSLLLIAVSGCYTPLPTAPPDPDFAAFESQIYPMLVRDCGFPDCHGAPERFFRVFGPGRTRELEETAITAEATESEIRATFERARSMLAGAARAEDSLLLRKPLEVDQGGAPHYGVDAYGRDVFPNKEDSRYEILREWAEAAPP
jgi:hypothetical protein